MDAKERKVTSHLVQAGDADASTTQHLSKKDLRRIRQYVTYLLGEMRLQHYTVLIDEASTEVGGTEGAWAAIQNTDGRSVVILAVNSTWGSDEDIDDRIRTHVLIHEMAHLFHRETWDHLQHLMWDGGFIPSATTSTVQEIIRDDQERMVDHIADVLEQYLKPYPLSKDAPVNPRVRLKGKGA